MFAGNMHIQYFHSIISMVAKRLTNIQNAFLRLKLTAFLKTLLLFLQDTIIVPTRHYYCSYKTVSLFLQDTIVPTITLVLQPDLYTK